MSRGPAKGGPPREQQTPSPWGSLCAHHLCRGKARPTSRQSGCLSPARVQYPGISSQLCQAGLALKAGMEEEADLTKEMHREVIKKG